MAEIMDFRSRGKIGDGVALDVDKVLDAAKGRFIQVVVCGFEPDGTFAVCASHGSRDALWKLTRGINFLMNESE